MKTAFRCVSAVTIALFATVAAGQGSSSEQAARAVALPGDQIVIKVWPQSGFGPPQSFLVSAEGDIVAPLIGNVSVSKVPISQLRDTLAKKFARFIVDPQVDAVVQRRVTVNGAVLRPDVYFMDVSATLRDAIARAGGVTEVGTRSKVSIIRDGQTFHVKDWETDTSPSSILRSGDQVLVGRRSWLEINIIPVASLGLATASFLLSLRR